jgi:hypothetical protein
MELHGMDWLKSIAVLTAVLALTMALTACSGSGRNPVRVAGIPAQLEHATIVEVENFAGSVRIISDPTIEPGVFADARRQGRDAPRRRGELQQLIHVEATSELDNGTRRLRVVVTPAPDARDVSADVTIRVARCIGTTVRNSGGRVELVGVSGPVDIENGIGGQNGGDVIVRTGNAMTAPVSVRTTTGSVVYQVAPGSTGRLDLASEIGQAEFSSRIGRVDGVRTTRTSWHGVLNGGKNDVVLRGERLVRMAVMENAATYTPHIPASYAPDRWLSMPRLH